MPKKISILYGSQTGNCQDIAERVWRLGKELNFHGPLLAMDDVEIKHLFNQDFVIFICSTTGQGDEPDNMKKFWKFLLRKRLPSIFFKGIKFAVLGLGDSSYPKYNFVAKRLHNRLLQLGGVDAIPLTLADDQHDLGYDAVVEPWIATFWSLISTLHKLPNTEPKLSMYAEPRWDIAVVNKTAYFNPDTVSAELREPKNPKNSFYVQVKENIRVTTDDHFQDVRLIKFKTNGESYEPGDVLYVRPKNSEEQVAELFSIFKEYNGNVYEEMIVRISIKDKYMPVPLFLQKTLFLKRICEEYFDLNAVPRKGLFNILAYLTTSELEKEKCLEFLTPEGQEDLYNYVNRPRRTILEVLRDFPHAVKHITVPLMFEIFSPIKPRAFSIASSFHSHTNEIHILVAVVKYKTKIVKERLGLCSNWLASLKTDDKILVWINKGSFKFPNKDDTPVIMVGPGTGVAPFRNFICEEEFYNRAKANTTILYFGCRNQEKDFLCKDDFKRLEDTGKLTLFCAFSRDQEHKIYVQHKIEEQGEKIWDLLNKSSTHIYVAGNSKNMPQSVREAFVNVCKKYGDFDNIDARSFMEKIDTEGRYQTETWS